MDCGFSLPSSSFIVYEWEKKRAHLSFMHVYALFSSQRRISIVSRRAGSGNWRGEISLVHQRADFRLLTTTTSTKTTAQHMQSPLQRAEKPWHANTTKLRWCGATSKRMKRPLRRNPEMQNALGSESKANQHDCPNAQNVHSSTRSKFKTPQE